jgi:hypothetical protein
MTHKKVSEAVGQITAILALAVKQGGNNHLGLQVREIDENERVLVDVTRAHSTRFADDTIIATVSVYRGAILRLAEQIKAEDERRVAHHAYQLERLQENKAAGLPFLTGMDDDGIFPPRNNEGSN